MRVARPQVGRREQVRQEAAEVPITTGFFRHRQGGIRSGAGETVEQPEES